MSRSEHLKRAVALYLEAGCTHQEALRRALLTLNGEK
jgi:hypothetical protein